MNVIGQPVDQLGPIQHTKTMPIHRPAPLFEDQATTPRCSKPVSRSWTSIQPFLKGGKIGLFGGAGWATVFIQELINTSPNSTADFSICWRR